MRGSVKLAVGEVGNQMRREFQKERLQGRDAICADRGGEGLEGETAEGESTPDTGM